MFEKIYKFLRREIKYILILLFIIGLAFYRIPYYIMAPGGTIDISDRVSVEGKEEINGSLNLLYATQYQATIPLYLLSFVVDSLDREKISNEQVSNETIAEIELRNKYLLNNSINNAIYVAYEASSKEITVKDKQTVVLAVTEDSPNKFKIGDILLSVNNVKIDDLNTLKELNDQNNEYNFVVLRDNKEITIKAHKDQEGKFGIVLVTNYEYNVPDDIEIKFKDSESGPSGGLMLSLSIYNAINDEDLVKGRKIAGTGTIDVDGTVGEIGGVKYKLIGAVRDKVDLMFVPVENYEECISLKEKYKYDIEIVKVHTFEEAITYLQEK